LDDDVESARNMKYLLYMFEGMSDLKINFNKSEVSMIGENNQKFVAYLDVQLCGGGLTDKILGDPSLWIHTSCDGVVTIG
jgi:hypothetical protein